MREVYNENPNSFKYANQILMDSFVDLCDITFDYINDLDIVEDLIHTVRTYDNKRRRKIVDLSYKGEI